MDNRFKKIIHILIFYIIAICLRYYIVEYNPAFLQNTHIYFKILLQGIGPLLGGLIVVKFMNRPNNLSLQILGFWKTILVIAIPILLFSLVGVFNTGTPYSEAPKIAGIIILYALFEEYGWRGYLQSELSGIRKIYKYLIITALWFIWHLNFELSFGNLVFFIVLFIASFGIGFVADKSKSLILCGLFHSFYNLSQTELLREIDLMHKLLIIGVSSFAIILIMISNKKEKITLANH